MILQTAKAFRGEVDCDPMCDQVPAAPGLEPCLPAGQIKQRAMIHPVVHAFEA